MNEWIKRVIAPSAAAVAGLAAMLLILTAIPRAWAIDADSQDWNFRVYLDDKPIGTHNFSVSNIGEETVLRSEADFEYKLLFVKVYDYEHENEETWRGDCLVSIRSQTDANGKPFELAGDLQDGEFRVTGSNGEASLPPCVMSFAYWDADMLTQSRLLNSQNGEYLDVEVSSPIPEELIVRGEPRQALRYRLTAGELKIDLWYSPNREWLGLETEARGGRILRYELI